MYFRTQKFNGALAKEWLDNKKPNRELSRSQIESYKRDMLGGHWKQNGATVARNNNKELLDGEHRLTALVEASTLKPDLEIVLDIAEDVAEDAHSTIDRGRKRSLADAWMIAGEKQAKVKAKALNALNRQTRGRMTMSVAEAEGLYNTKYKAGVDWLMEKFSQIDAKEKRNLGYMLQGNVLGALVHAYNFNPGKVNEFFDDLRTGGGSCALPNSPTLRLRDNLMAVSRRKSDPLFWVTLSALYRFIHNKEMINMVPGASAVVREYFELK